MRLDEIVNLFQARKVGGQYLAHCPCTANHTNGDRHPSLSIAEGDDGRILLNCLSQHCDIETICAVKGITVADLFAKNGQPATARPRSREKKPQFEGTPEDVEKFQTKLATEEGQTGRDYLETRGISLRIATELKIGFAVGHFPIGDTFVTGNAIAFPHYAGEKLVGIKFKSIEPIEGARQYTQMTGSSLDGLYGLSLLDTSREDVAVFEGPEDTALALTHSINAVGINSANAKLSDADIRILSRFKRVFLVGDQDLAGKKAMDALQLRLAAPKQVIRVKLGFKDITDFWRADQNNFAVKFRRAMRAAQGSGLRDHFIWDDLLDDDELKIPGIEQYAVDQLIPRNAITMFFAREKSGKSELSRYFGKCVANTVKVFGKYGVIKMPVVVLDLENNADDFEAFRKHFERLGPEKLKYFTRETGVPSLDSPALLEICEKEKPLIIVDSMTKFLNGADAFHPGQMSIFFDKLLNLCAAGATIILIHHTTRDDFERYANSHQIGANVANSYCVVSEDWPRCERIRFEGQLNRRGAPITENLLAFPHILTHGEFALAAPESGAAIDPRFERICICIRDFKAKHGRKPTREDIKHGVSMGRTTTTKLVNAALEDGRLVIDVVAGLGGIDLPENNQK